MHIYLLKQICQFQNKKLRKITTKLQEYVQKLMILLIRKVRCSNHRVSVNNMYYVLPPRALITARILRGNFLAQLLPTLALL
jgi:hypothetical protein